MFLKPLWAKKSRIGPSNFYPAQELVILQLKVKDPFWKELLQPSYEQKDRDAICQVFRPVLGKHCSSFVWSNHLSLKTHHDTNLNIWTLVWISFGFNVNKSQFSKQTLWLGMVWWRYGLFQPWQLPSNTPSHSHPLRIVVPFNQDNVPDKWFGTLCTCQTARIVAMNMKSSIQVGVSGIVLLLYAMTRFIGYIGNGWKLRWTNITEVNIFHNDAYDHRPGGVDEHYDK